MSSQVHFTDNPLFTNFKKLSSQTRSTLIDLQIFCTFSAGGLLIRYVSFFVLKGFWWKLYQKSGLHLQISSNLDVFNHSKNPNTSLRDKTIFHQYFAINCSKNLSDQFIHPKWWAFANTRGKIHKSSFLLSF